ncbi:MAG: helix-turn-helix domain-containing protein [Chitinophagaceae bacterium]|nr:helix-turn-helix domain-containing protein [Chitinophagaceae bacterium]
MLTFGKKMRDIRETKNISQADLAQALSTNPSLIGKYEKDEVKPSVDAIKKLAEALGTTAGYLLDDSTDFDFLKDAAMLKRFNDLNMLPEPDREHILYTLDSLIKAAKLKSL